MKIHLAVDSLEHKWIEHQSKGTQQSLDSDDDLEGGIMNKRVSQSAVHLNLSKNLTRTLARRGA